MNIEPAMLLRRVNKMSNYNSTTLVASITPSLSQKDIWYGDVTSPSVDHVHTNDIVFVASVVSGPFDTKVTMLVTSRAIGWYPIKEVESSGFWEEV